MKLSYESKPKYTLAPRFPIDVQCPAVRTHLQHANTHLIFEIESKMKKKVISNRVAVLVTYQRTTTIRIASYMNVKWKFTWSTFDAVYNTWLDTKARGDNDQ